MKTALFVASDKGRGHLVRCEALAAELKTRGWQIRPWPVVQEGDVLIVDTPDDDAINAFGRGKVPIVAIVDTPGVRDCDLLVCGGAWATADVFVPPPGPGDGYGPRRGILAGPQHALLRPDFRAVRWGEHGFSSSHDVYDLREVRGESAEVLARNIAASRVVITYGGMRAMEAACVGSPLVIVPRNGGERLNAEGLIRAGAAVQYWGSPEGVAEKVIGSPALSAAARALVDGLGCQRVADEIERLVA